MKLLFSLSITLLILFFISIYPKTVSAQCNVATGENCYICVWNGIDCEANRGNYPVGPGCLPGFDYPTPNPCESINDMFVCQSTVNLDCEPVVSAGCYVCESATNICQPLTDPNDPNCEYATVTQCQDACTGGVIYCDCNTGTGLCVPNPGGTQRCSLCEPSCGNLTPIPTSPPPTLTAAIQLTPRPALDPRCQGNWGSIYTAIGCVPVNDATAYASFVLRWAIGIAGGVSFILIVYASFLIMTSSGNPRQIQAGRELLTSAIAGLMLLIFSVFVLEVIGVRILRLPGF